VGVIVPEVTVASLEEVPAAIERLSREA
jgi:hypothetical protein